MTILPSPQQLRYLVALAETRHFTPLGLELVDRARTALAALEAVSEAAAAAREPLSGPLRFGVIPTIGPFLLPKLMPALRAAFPRLRLYLREDTTARLVDRLAANRLDLLLLALPCDCGGADALQVARDNFLVALPPDHRLAAEETIPVSALSSERLLLLEDGHCLRDQALAVCGLLAGERGEQDGFAATSLHTLVQMVDNGLGLTMLPEMALDAGILNGTNVVARPLASPNANREIALVWRKNSPRTEEFHLLAEELRAG